jgi:hypothetical protein
VNARHLLLSLAACAAAVVGDAAVASPVGAVSTLVSFQSPSHHIGCYYYPADELERVNLRCDLSTIAHRPKRPKWCDLDYGDAFGLYATGKGRRLCVGDTALNPKAKVLAYGKTRHLGPFTCTSQTTGMRCVTRAGHGFDLSRERQKVF